ncbi:MAG: 50S ribosomal protein L23 [Candidatus Paceibacterota bacterium]
MALFGKKEKPQKAEQKKEARSTKKVASDTVTLTGKPSPMVLVRPHITEKAAVLTDANVYVFQVTPESTKYTIKKAVRDLYKKTPVKVRIARKAPKTVMRRTGEGKKPGLKKAYVFMKKGEVLDIL